jgi:Ran GTPase-activating protein (RanGAP) involved in mRNA processing and transport
MKPTDEEIKKWILEERNVAREEFDSAYMKKEKDFLMNRIKILNALLLKIEMGK